MAARTPPPDGERTSRERELAARKKRYKTDAAYRRRLQNYARNRYRENEAYHNATLERARKRYHTDPVYRAATIARSAARRRTKPPSQRAKSRATTPKRPKPVAKAATGGARRGRPPGLYPGRQLALQKLRLGTAPLTEGELRWVLPQWRAEAAEVKPRSLQAVGTMVGLTRERVRQLLG